MSNAVTYEAFFDDLLGAVPEYRAAYDADVRHYGELLPHVILGAFTAWLAGIATQGLDNGNDVLRRAVTFLERAFTIGDDRVVELIAVSFVENLAGPHDDEGSRRVREALGPRLRAELRRHEPGY
jgi:hypothetical protein